MAYLGTSGQLIGNNVIYLSSNILNSVPLTEDAILKSPQQILTATSTNAIKYQPIDPLSCVEGIKSRINDTSFIDNFSFLENEDPLAVTDVPVNTTALSQQPIIFSYLPQVSLQLTQQSDRDNNTLDFVNNLSLIDTSGIQTAVNNLPLSNDLVSASTVPQTNESNEPALPISSGPLLRPNLRSRKQNLENNITSVKKNKTIEIIKHDNEIFRGESPPIPEVKEGDLTRMPGRPRKDGTSLFSIKKMMKCRYCDKKYLFQSMLRKHLQKAHAEENMKHPCKHGASCNSTFDTMEGLLLHTADHWSPRQKCPLGGLSTCIKFSNKNSLRAHLTRYHIEGASEERPYPCKQCQLSFDRPSQLKRHLMTHTGEKPFRCSECKHAFAQKNALAIHMLTHTKERPHKCPYCLATFTQQYNRFTHLFNIHYKHAKTKGGVECERCFNTFPDHRSAFRHYMKFHKDLAKSYFTRNINPVSTSSKKKWPIILQTGPSNPHKENKKKSATPIQYKKANLPRRKVAGSTLFMEENERLLQEFESVELELIQDTPENITQPALNSTQTNKKDDLLEISNTENKITAINYISQDGNLQNHVVKNPLIGGYVNAPTPFNVYGNFPVNNTCLVFTLNAENQINGNIVNILPSQAILNETSDISNTNTKQSPSLNNSKSLNPIESSGKCHTNVIEPAISTNESSFEFVNFHTKTVVNNSDTTLNVQQIKEIRAQANTNCDFSINEDNISGSKTVNKTSNNSEKLPGLIPVSPQLIKYIKTVGVSKNVEKNPPGYVIVTSQTPEVSQLSGIKTAENIGSVEKNIGVIKVCLTNTVNLSQLQKSNVTKTRLKLNKNISRAFKSPKLKNQCDLCPASFKKPSDLDRHYRTHTKEKPFACTVCKTTFSFKSALKKHMDNPNNHKMSRLKKKLRKVASTQIN